MASYSSFIGSQSEIYGELVGGYDGEGEIMGGNAHYNFFRWKICVNHPYCST